MVYKMEAEIIDILKNNLRDEKERNVEYIKRLYSTLKI